MIIKILKFFIYFKIMLFFILIIFNLYKNIFNLVKYYIKKNKNLAIINFSFYFIKYLFIIFIIFFIFNLLNIKIYSLITILNTIFITIGLSLKNSLSNLASGILIIMLNIYKIEDYIIFNDIKGKIIDIKLFNTFIIDDYENIIIIPNNTLFNKVIKKINKEEVYEIKLYVNKNFINFNSYRNKIVNILNNLKIKIIAVYLINILKNDTLEVCIIFKSKPKYKNINISKILENIII